MGGELEELKKKKKC